MGLDVETKALLRAMETAVGTLARMPDMLRQALTDHQWSRIPLFVDEFAYSANQGVGVPLVVTPQFDSLELIESVVAIVPAGATASVQLGLKQLTLGAGVTVMAPVKLLLQRTDTRAITLQGGGGPCSLWLTGEQLPTFGVLGR